MTNFERIKDMSVEELAWELLEFRFDAYAKATGNESALLSSQKDISEWLESEVQDEADRCGCADCAYQKTAEK